MGIVDAVLRVRVGFFDGTGRDGKVLEG